jgi:hypothetical protein
MSQNAVEDAALCLGIARLLELFGDGIAHDFTHVDI